ncbi:hypothetical protein ACFU8X_30080, partial [Brevibacillus porteri]|uniref:hypothetical protein n=1 Tax=Brevibacillus porteri TaxID=2126350 RepID=UPI00370C1BAD
LEGDRPNEERIQATGKHVAGLPHAQPLEDDDYLFPGYANKTRKIAMKIAALCDRCIELY